MAVTTQSGVPCKIRAGDTTIFTVENTDYSPATHSASLLLQKVATGVSLSAINATESGSTYTFTISAATSAAWSPGSYQWAIRYTVTADSTVETGETGMLDILPNIGTSQTASTAATLLAALETAIATVTASPHSSISFNGQSVTFGSLSMWYQERNRLRAEVIKEQRAALKAAGLNDGTLYQAQFRRDC